MKDWGVADSDMMDRFPEIRERRLKLMQPTEDETAALTNDALALASAESRHG